MKVSSELAASGLFHATLKSLNFLQRGLLTPSARAGCGAHEHRSRHPALIGHGGDKAMDHGEFLRRAQGAHIKSDQECAGEIDIFQTGVQYLVGKDPFAIRLIKRQYGADIRKGLSLFGNGRP